MYPQSLQQLIDSFRKLPGVGARTAERYAFQLLNMSRDEVETFANSLKQAKNKLHSCRTCGNIADEEECVICKDKHRDATTICVVQHVKDVAAMERTREYQGVYHVLGGAISTVKGILPEDLNIESLIRRAADAKEIIIATNPTLEGETTSLYLAKRLEGKVPLVTRLAHGLPMGGHVDYADELTLIKAMEGRNKL
ncbi:MAG: recombination protein RecR [Firmicutes bacterium GWF2_51_9]|mgnify:FL=1|nr:recombination protein RecR [Erysipelotrichaceae bacterium]OGS53264.1 MAG: recombination protein RecR [Firmicutes bacterium GWF2_51_9]OGS58146.1 MAG: recombination protein RecR [Firmicutes bacterium GWE2_51_13]HAM63322.1 recombination protein RecR [Erysipelotrichaceae bacterium]HAO61189.1 recombination protein RecR [Erysipelotrichaceae bacterium]